jgi:hypothetical protein
MVMVMVLVGRGGDETGVIVVVPLLVHEMFLSPKCQCLTYKYFANGVQNKQIISTTSENIIHIKQPKFTKFKAIVFP